jgi:hypothetical protein
VPKFEAILEIIGINPFVFVPEKILKAIFKKAGKDKGPIPIKGELNGKAYKQTLVKYSGHWRLYVNLIMLKNSPKRIGEKIKLSVDFDPEDRNIKAHPDFVKALKTSPLAKKNFETLIPSRQKEILRYLNHLKTAETLNRNITKAILHLEGKSAFAGRP